MDREWKGFFDATNDYGRTHERGATRFDSGGGTHGRRCQPNTGRRIWDARAANCER